MVEFVIAGPGAPDFPPGARYVAVFCHPGQWMVVDLDRTGPQISEHPVPFYETLEAAEAEIRRLCAPPPESVRFFYNDKGERVAAVTDIRP